MMDYSARKADLEEVLKDSNLTFQNTEHLNML